MSQTRHEVPDTVTDEVRARTLSLLNDHVPLSLILDMSAPAGPDSEQLLREEHATTEAWIPTPR